VGDIVEGNVKDLNDFLPALTLLTRAPLGAWDCHGNHDYYTEAPDRIRDELDSIGIRTLRNESIVIDHLGASLTMGGIDDRILGDPDWERLVAINGAPHILLVYNPDDFYEAERRGIALVLSCHTHGGQIRFRKGPPIVRESQFCLDEGLYVHETVLAVSRGLGAIGLPWRAGADPRRFYSASARPTVDTLGSYGAEPIGSTRHRGDRLPENQIPSLGSTSSTRARVEKQFSEDNSRPDAGVEVFDLRFVRRLAGQDIQGRLLG
jgi:hypothetical protein